MHLIPRHFLVLNDNSKDFRLFVDWINKKCGTTYDKHSKQYIGCFYGYVQYGNRSSTVISDSPFYNRDIFKFFGDDFVLFSMPTEFMKLVNSSKIEYEEKIVSATEFQSKIINDLRPLFLTTDLQITIADSMLVNGKVLKGVTMPDEHRSLGYGSYLERIRVEIENHLKIAEE